MNAKFHGIDERKGVAAVEFAALLPFLVLIVVIGVDFARIYYHALTLTNAARNGAMFAASHPDNVSKTSQIEAVALADTTNLSPSPTVTSATGTDSAGNPYVEVTVSWDFYTITGYPGVPRPFPLNRTVRMRVSPKNPRQDPYSGS